MHHHPLIDELEMSFSLNPGGCDGHVMQSDGHADGIDDHDRQILVIAIRLSAANEAGR